MGKREIKGLARRVEDAASVLGAQRRLVLVQAANDLDTLVGYLGALHGGHPTLVVPPAGIDAFYPDKRGQLVVVVPRGESQVKLRVAPDSVWGYVTDKGRTYRMHRGEEYRLVHADTLSVYISTTEATSGTRPGAVPRYYFSRGLTGLVFPLTLRYLREAYAAGNPAFVAALAQMPFHHSLADFDRKTGLYRVTTIYRQALGR